MMTAPNRPIRTRNGRTVGSISVSGSLQQLDGDDRQAAADECAHEAADLWQRPGAQPEQGPRSTTNTTANASKQVHHRIVAQAP